MPKGNYRVVPGMAKPRSSVKRTGSTRRAAKLTDKQRALVEKRLYLCEMTAKKFVSKCPQISLEDFYQASFEGLSDAIKGFDRSKKVKFKTYAYLRMAGACLDMMREEGTIRVTRKCRVDLKAAGETLRFVSLDEDRRGANGSRSRDDWRAKDQLPDDLPPIGSEMAADDDFEAWISELRLLSRFVFRKYYGPEAWSMARIGKHLELSESRVWQIYNKALETLRRRAHSPRFRRHLEDRREYAGSCS